MDTGNPHHAHHTQHAPRRDAPAGNDRPRRRRSPAPQATLGIDRARPAATPDCRQIHRHDSRQGADHRHRHEIGEQAMVAAGGGGGRSIARSRGSIWSARSAPATDGAGASQRGIIKCRRGARCCSPSKLRLVYGAADGDHAHVGDLQQNNDIGVHIERSIGEPAFRHRRRVGKSSSIVVVLRRFSIPGRTPRLPGRPAQRIRPLLPR